MSGIWRTLRLALRYRATLVGIVISSLLMGALWGANISVIYPFVEVVFLEKTIKEWAAEERVRLQQDIERLQVQASSLCARLQPARGADRIRYENQLGMLTGKLEITQHGIAWMHRLQPWIDRYAPSTAFRTLLAIVAVLLIGSVLKDICLVANMVLVERLVQLVVFDVRKQFYRQTLRQDMASFHELPSSELLARFTNDISALSSGLNNIVGKAVREPLRMVACLIGAAWISWQLLLFSLLIAPPCLLAMQWLAKSLKRNSRKALEDVAQMFRRLTETFSGIQTVKAFTMEPYERLRFHNATKKIYHVMLRISLYSALTKPVTELFGVGVICLALIAGTYLALNQETHLLGIKMCDRPLSAPALMLFYGMLAGVSDPARKLSDIFGFVQAGSAAADRLFPLIDRQPLIIDPEQPQTPARPHGRLVFENVSFHYRLGQPVLRGVSFEVPFGESVAIVGPNGCGKTTLMNLMLRFYDPVEGSIQFDGVDIRSMRIRDLRERIGLVSQTTQLFDESVTTNIRYGSPTATDEQVRSAAVQAHAHRFITEKLPEGYETQIGQGGLRLSGGQRQRIAMARAILRQPDVLILDEATSQIDIESEQHIHLALEEFIAGRTAIMITHRLSTLTLADRIIVMDGGSIVDIGTHWELLDRCQVYQRLHDMHFRQSA